MNKNNSLTKNDAVECIACDQRSATLVDKLQFEGLVQGEKFSYTAPGFLCKSCGQQWITAAEGEAHDTEKADVYRKKHALLTSTEMERARDRLGLTVSALCEQLRIPRMTYRRWLKGQVQSEAMDQALKAKIEPASAALNNLRLIFSEYREKDPSLTGKNPLPSYEKLFLMIAFFVSRKELKKLGMLYLNKLCWYADQLAYNIDGQSISGTPYVKLQYGPVIHHYDQIFRSMLAEEYLAEDTQPTDLKNGPKKLALTDLPIETRRILTFVWDSFKNQLPKLPELSHKEHGWKNVEDLSEIPFHLSKNLKALDQEKYRRTWINK